MSRPPSSYSAIGLALVALSLGACNGQGQGESCSTQSNDCQSSLTCVPIPGYQYLGKCCAAGSQCSDTQTGFMLSQDGGDASTDADADADVAANAAADADALEDGRADVDAGLEAGAEPDAASHPATDAGDGDDGDGG
jgi:hypothetical protein